MTQTTTPSSEITKVTPPEPGMYPKVRFEEYLAWDAIDATILKAMAHNAEMGHHRMTCPEADKDAYVKGRLFHLLSTQPDRADKEFILQPATYIADRGTDKGKEKPWNGNAIICKQWFVQQLQSGLTVVAKDVYDEASAMAAKVRNHPKLGPLVWKGDVELSVVWRDPTTGLTCKARYDVYKEHIIVDLKSTSSTAAADSWFAQAYRRKYHIQCAMYVDSQKILDPSDAVPWFAFGVVEGYAPHCIAVYDVHDDADALSYAFLQLGRAKYMTLLQELKACMDRDEWPGYGDEHRDMELPAWVKDAEMYEMR